MPRNNVVNPFASDTAATPDTATPEADDMFGSPSDSGAFEVDLSGVVSNQVDAGEYEVEVTAITKGQSQAGNPQWIWDFRIVQADSKFKGASARLYTALTPNSLWKVKETIESLGLPQENGKPKFTKDDVLGRRAIGVFLDEEYQGVVSGRLNRLRPHPKGAGYREPKATDL